MHAKGSLNPSLNGTIPVDVPGGVYILVLSATWDEGDIYSVFKIEVNSENLDKSVAIEMWINGTQQERWGALQWLKDNELYEGMLVDDMKTILGEPTSTRADGTFEYAASDYVGILVEHASGVVVSISYYEV